MPMSAPKLAPLSALLFPPGVVVPCPGSCHGLWLSLVERLVRDEEAVGSNPTSPTNFLPPSLHERIRLQDRMNRICRWVRRNSLLLS